MYLQPLVVDLFLLLVGGSTHISGPSPVTSFQCTADRDNARVDGVYSIAAAAPATAAASFHSRLPLSIPPFTVLAEFGHAEKA